MSPRAVTEIPDLSPADAKTQLENMTAAYQKQTPAADKLAGMLKDSALMRTIEHGGAHGGSEGVALPGGPTFNKVQEVIAEFHAEQGSVVDLAMAGRFGDVNDSGYLEKVRTVEALRADGIDDGAIRQLISNEPVSRAEHERVQKWRSEALENPVFTAAYLKGDPASVRMMTNANIVLTSPIKEDA